MRGLWRGRIGCLRSWGRAVGRDNEIPIYDFEY
jgi:hypothetical protein